MDDEQDSTEDIPKLELVTALSVRQRRAVALLAGGVTAVDVAKQLNISRATIERWKKEPGFNAALESQSFEDYRRLRACAMQVGFEALQTLRGVLKDGIDDFGRQADKVRAAEAILRALGMGGK